MLDHAHIFVNVSLYNDYYLPMSKARTAQSYDITPIFIFWIHKLSALISSWKVFSSNFGKQTF